MFTLLRSLTTRQLFVEQLPIFLVSFVIAEMFYKFHSFTLECAAFLVTWFVLDYLAMILHRAFGPSRGTDRRDMG